MDDKNNPPKCSNRSGERKKKKQFRRGGGVPAGQQPVEGPDPGAGPRRAWSDFSAKSLAQFFAGQAVFWLELGPSGKEWFRKLGIEVDRLRSSRRCFARQCLDWTERPHIAGALGAAICTRLVALGWNARRRETRALRVTQEGARQMSKRFGISAR